VKHPFSRATDRGDLKCANVCNRAKKQAGVSEGKMIKKIIWGGGGWGLTGITARMSEQVSK